ncbi:transposase [Streptomyces sp. NPDC005727]|uniref:transposase n=1 Tax=Streptomyces sp. NPDC005727 TaxID=3157053 RepID=UPI0033D2FA1D
MAEGLDCQDRLVVDQGGRVLESRRDVGVPELTARVVRASFPKGTLAIRIREALGPLFKDSSFAQAFPGRGRPAISPGALALVSVLQYAEGLSDRQAAEQVRARMDWKFLLGLELDDPGFDFTVLGDFRARLIEHGLEERVLDLVLERISGLGLLRTGGRQRTDSTHVLASVRVLNRMEFVGETLRAALEALAAAAPNWLAGQVTAAWAERYGARIDSYRFPKGENVRQEWAEQVGKDGFTLLEAVFSPSAPTWLRQIPAIEVLRQAWVEQYHRDGEGVRWREAKDLPPARRRLSSPYDLDARYGMKRGSGWCGYKMHLTETCEPDAPHVITNRLNHPRDSGLRISRQSPSKGRGRQLPGWKERDGLRAATADFLVLRTLAARPFCAGKPPAAHMRVSAVPAPERHDTLGASHAAPQTQQPSEAMYSPSMTSPVVGSMAQPSARTYCRCATAGWGRGP